MNSLKITRIALVSLLALLLLSAFTFTPVKMQAPTRPPRDQMLIIARVGTPTLNWNPFAAGVIGIDDDMRHLAYLPAAALNGYNLQWTFILIKKLEFDGENIIARVQLWDNAKWSDGTPITVRDIIGSFNLSRQIGGGWWGDWYVYNYAAVDDKTIEYYIGRRPDEPMPARENIRTVVQGGVLYFRPLPYHVLSKVIEQMGDKMKTDWKNDDPATQVVSGPYKLYYYDPTQVIYQRVDDWWGKDIFGLPAPKYIAFMYYRDAQTAVAALQNGDVDIYFGYVPNPLDLIRVGMGTWYKDSPYFLLGGATWFVMNFKLPFFNITDVRRAIVWAIPYDAIIKYALLGLSVQASMTGLNDLYPHLEDFVNREACREYWGTETCRPNTDLEKAESILNAAGIVDRDGDGVRELVLPNGTVVKLKFTIAVPATWTPHVIAAQLIADSLNNIGFSVIVDAQDYRVWDQNVRNSQFDATISWAAGGALGTATPFTDLYGNIFEARNYKQWALWANYLDEDVTAFITEMNFNYMFPEQLKEVVYLFQEQILFERIPAIPLWYDPLYYVYNPKYWDGFPNEDRPLWYPSWWGATFFYFVIVPKGQTPQVPWYLKPVSQGGASIHGWNDFYKAQGMMVRQAYDTTWEVKLPTPTTTSPSPSPTPTTTSPSPSPTPTTTSPSPSPTPTTPTPGVTQTVTITIPTTAVTTVAAATTTLRETVPTTITQTTTEWTTTIVLAIALFAIGFAIAWFIRRR
jgi:ABC-type dipeptide transport system, periplasmic component